MKESLIWGKTVFSALPFCIYIFDLAASFSVLPLRFWIGRFAFGFAFAVWDQPFCFGFLSVFGRQSVCLRISYDLRYALVDFIGLFFGSFFDYRKGGFESFAAKI